MKRLYTPGRLIALPLLVIVTVFLWGIFFPPGGSGSNIILALVAAGALVYSGTIRVGRYFDVTFFHGGSKERAEAFEKAIQALDEGRTKWKLLKKRGRSRISQTIHEQVENSFRELEQELATVRQEWSQSGHAAKQVLNLAHVSRRLEQALNEAVKIKPIGWWQRGWGSLAVALVAALALRAFIVEPFQIPSGSMIPTLLVGDHLFVAKLRYGIMNPFSKEPQYWIRWASPTPGQVVIFQAPNYVGTHAGETWIKRAIATAGQTVRITEGVVYVDDVPYKHTTPDEVVTYMDYFSYGDPGRFFSAGPGLWREQEAVFTHEEIPNSVVHSIYNRLPGQRLPYEDNWPLPDTQLPGLHCNDTNCTVDDGHIFVMGDNRGNSADGRMWGALPVEAVKGQAIFVWMSVDGSKDSVNLGRFTVPDFRWSRWMTMIR